MQAELPQIGEEWECEGFTVIVEDILETTSKSFNTKSFVIVINHKSIKAYMDINTFLFSFTYVKRELKEVINSFNLDQEKNRLERLYKVN